MAPASPLRRVLTARRVRQAASTTSFARGEAYLAEGRVHSLVESGAALTATVRGTETYAVRLSATDGTLDYRCSCPVGTDGEFCKHAVAVALAWLAADTTDAETPSPPVIKLDDLRPWLLEQGRETLTTWLLEVAARDERLREKLLHQAARAKGNGVDLRTWRQALDRAIPAGESFDYHETRTVAARIRDAIESIAELLNEGDATAAIELAEHALNRVERLLDGADDSDGELNAILGELQDLHLRACEIARPDPVALAARLVDWELRGNWNVFYGAVETYASLLGEKGRVLYRARIEAEWKSLPVLKPGEREDYSSRRFRVTSIMETLARAGDDLEALVAVKAKDLSHAYGFLQIAELYHAAGKNDQALDWAERGLKAFPENTDSRLIDFLAFEYHRRRRHDDALALIWGKFEAHPALETYQSLKEHADLAKTWPAWRERALEHFRRLIAQPAARASKRVFRWEGVADHSQLVRIFLWEKDLAAAWREAQAGGCNNALWLEVAAAREKAHPADAVPIYVREARRLVALANNSAYAEAIALLRKAKALLLRLERRDEWERTLQRLRTEHKAKRNFIALAATL